MTPSFDQLHEEVEPVDGEGYVVSEGGRISLELFRRLEDVKSKIPFQGGEVLRFFTLNSDPLIAE